MFQASGKNRVVFNLGLTPNCTLKVFTGIFIAVPHDNR
jgi:hypothetical protein